MVRLIRSEQKWPTTRCRQRPHHRPATSSSKANHQQRQHHHHNHPHQSHHPPLPHPLIPQILPSSLPPLPLLLPSPPPLQPSCLLRRLPLPQILQNYPNHRHRQRVCAALTSDSPLPSFQLTTGSFSSPPSVVRSLPSCPPSHPPSFAFLVQNICIHT